MRRSSEPERYVPRGGRAGAERLRLLNRVKWPTTEALLGAVGAFEDAGVTWLLRGMVPWEVPLGRAYEIVRPSEPARFVGLASNGAFAPDSAGVFVLALVQAQD